MFCTRYRCRISSRLYEFHRSRRLLTCDCRTMADAIPSVSIFLLSQLGAVLFEDDMFTLTSLQQARILELLHRSQAYQTIATRQQARTRLHSLSEVAVAVGKGRRRASEWSPDILPRQLVKISGLSEHTSTDSSRIRSGKKLDQPSKESTETHHE